MSVFKQLHDKFSADHLVVYRCTTVLHEGFENLWGSLWEIFEITESDNISTCGVSGVSFFLSAERAYLGL